MPHATLSKFSVAIGVSTSLLSHLQQEPLEPYARPLGRSKGRLIEKVFGLPLGCMDVPDGVLAHLDKFCAYWKEYGIDAKPAR